MYYSKSTGGFYSTEIHGDNNIPSDAVEITDAEHATLLEGQSQGKRIVGDSTGRPVLEAPPAPTHSELMAATLAETFRARIPIINILDGMQTSALVLGEMVGDQPKALVIETAKQGLRDITLTDLSACTTAEEMKGTILNAYKAIALALPASVRSAFASMVG